MIPSRIASIGALCFLILFIGCAAKETAPVGAQIPFSTNLEPHPQNVQAMLYLNPDAPDVSYSRFIIDPVEIYQGKDNGFGDLPLEDIREMADFIPREITRIIGTDYPVVDKPGPGTMRIKLILVGLEKTNSVLRTLTYGNPMGLATNLAKGMSGSNGAYLGSITLAGEFEDSQTGVVRAAFMGTLHPFSLDISFSAWDAAKFGVTKFAQDFKETLDRKLK